MATTKNIGQILVDKAKDLDPTYKPDKFNDMGEAAQIILNNIGTGSGGSVIAPSFTVTIASNTSINPTTGKPYAEPRTVTFKIKMNSMELKEFKDGVISAVSDLAEYEISSYEQAIELLITMWPQLPNEYRSMLLQNLARVLYFHESNWYVFDPDNEFGGQHTYFGKIISMNFSGADSNLYGVNILPSGTEFVNLTQGFCLGEEFNISINEN